MENEVAEVAVVHEIFGGSSPTAEGNFDMMPWAARSSSGILPPSILTLHLTQAEMQHSVPQMWATRKLLQPQAMVSGCTTTVALPASPQSSHDEGPSWDASLLEATCFRHERPPPNAPRPARHPVAELWKLPTPELDHFVHQTSRIRMPQCDSSMKDAQEEPRLLQLFVLERTASDLEEFNPVPLWRSRIPGVLHGLDVTCRCFSGSSASLLAPLSWPAVPVHGSLDASYCFGGAPLHISNDPEFEVAQVLLTIDYACGTKDVSTIKSPSQRESADDGNDGDFVIRPALSATSSAPSYNLCGSSSSQEGREKLLPAPSVGALSCGMTSRFAIEGLLPPGTSDDHPPQRFAGSSPDTFAIALSASTSTSPVLDLCRPWSLCQACNKFWGILDLPQTLFEKEVDHAPHGDVPAILCSVKTAARKRKWTQSRHGPASKTSEYRGVNLYKRTWKWEAHIWHNSEQLYLGASVTKIHAAQVYDRAALFLFGPDAEVNFKPERYQEEYEFMQRLSYGQMVVYLRRECRQNGEEVRYPGVAKLKVNVFVASYRPRKEKESNEHIGYFLSEEEAVRAVLDEARQRRNYKMIAKILDVHHLRTVKPAPGTVKEKHKAREFDKVSALKVVTSSPSMRSSSRTQLASANPNCAFQIHATDFPAEDHVIGAQWHQNGRKTPNSQEDVAKDHALSIFTSLEEPQVHRCEDIRVPPPETTLSTKCNNTRKITHALKNMTTPKRSTPQPISKMELTNHASIVEAMGTTLFQDDKATKRRENCTKPRSSQGAKKRRRRSTSSIQSLLAFFIEDEESLPTPLCKNQPPTTPTLALPPTSPQAFTSLPFVAYQLPKATEVMATIGLKASSDSSPNHQAHNLDSFANHQAHNLEAESKESGILCNSPLLSQSPKPEYYNLSNQNSSPVYVMSQFEHECSLLALHRRHMHALTNPWLSQTREPLLSSSLNGSGVIRPIARRLPFGTWAPQATDVSFASSSNAQIEITAYQSAPCPPESVVE